MKTLGRILIILTVAALVTAGLYLLINAASGGSAPTSGLSPHRERIRPSSGFQPNGAPPEFEGGRSERGERDGVFLPFGWIKNIAVIGIVVAILVLPKGVAKRKRLTVINAKADDTV